MLDSVALALAFYRAPFEHQELRKAQFLMPTDTDRLLRIAGSNHQTTIDFATNLGLDVSPEELKEAAVFFIQQIFFINEANHYRVLGLNPDAEQKRIREHHRLLIRLFHPDRQQAQEIWTEVYAERVNEAYNVLRKPDSRRAYDLTLKPAYQAGYQSTSNNTVPPGFSRNTGFNSNRVSNRRLPRFLQKNLPQTLLGGSAVVAALLVFGVYLSNHPLPILTMLANSTQTVEQTSVSELADNHNKVVNNEVVINNKAKESVNKPAKSAKPASEPPSPWIDKPKPVLSSNSSAKKTVALPLLYPAFSDHSEYLKQRPKDTVAVQQPKYEVVDELNLEVVATIAKTKKSTPTKKTPNKPVPESISKLAKAKTTTTPKQEQENPTFSRSIKSKHSEVSGVELEILTSLFIGAYERGNVEELMTLFDERARANNKAGKSNIREDYEDFFVKTHSRTINLRQLRWQKNGLSASGRGLYQVRVNGEKGVKNYTGTIRFEVKKKNKRVLITKLSHKALF